jgi:mRNA-degrading endonuclease toxin of MazEF toxin-antitoxin module
MRKTSALFHQRIETKIMCESWKHDFDVKVGEFWWYYEWINIGNEISKDGQFKRPCLIVKNMMGNGLILVCPLTTKFHSWRKDYFISVTNYQNFNLKPSQLVINQIKLIDSKRFAWKISNNKASLNFVKLILFRYCNLIKK